jgi:UMF1 family MFS transporter
MSAPAPPGVPAPPRTGGGKPVDRRAIWSWCLYDFANSSFTTLIITFLYSAYFTEVMAGSTVEGTALWSRGITITALVVAVLSPPLGALADRGGYRKRLTLAFTLTCVTACALLSFIAPGQALPALVLVVIANIAFEMGGVFYNAFLPDLAPRHRIGRISGYAWGLGYLGGLLALVVAYVLLIRPAGSEGTPTLVGEGGVRASALLVAVWFAVFSLPLFLFVKEDRSTVSAPGRVFRDAYAQTMSLFRDLRRYKQATRFLVARLFYNEGLVTVFNFGGIYAAGTFHFSFTELVAFGIGINVAAGVGAFALGHLDDWIGGKLTTLISVAGLGVAAALAVVAQGRGTFWTAALLVGFLAGPNQAASRSLMGRFAPPDRENEFFGLFALSGKATSFIGPLMMGVLTQMFGSQRAGVSIVVVLLAVGFWLLLRVDEAEGIKAAGRPVG